MKRISYTLIRTLVKRKFLLRSYCMHCKSSMVSFFIFLWFYVQGDHFWWNFRVTYCHKVDFAWRRQNISHLISSNICIVFLVLLVFVQLCVDKKRMVWNVGVNDLTWRFWLYSDGKLLFWCSYLNCCFVRSYDLVLDLDSWGFPTSIGPVIFRPSFCSIEHSRIFHWERLVVVRWGQDIVEHINVSIETEWESKYLKLSLYILSIIFVIRRYDLAITARPFSLLQST